MGLSRILVTLWFPWAVNVAFPTEGYLFLAFFCGRFWIFVWVPDSMLSCFSAFLLYAFPASLLVCFSALPASFLFCFSAFPASLLFCFCALPASFLFCFSAFPASLLLCFCALLLCFSAWCLYSLFVFSFLLLYSLLFVNTLGETQRNLKEILIRTPDKKPYMKP